MSSPFRKNWPYLASLALSVLCTTLLGGKVVAGFAVAWLLFMGALGLWYRWRRLRLSRPSLFVLGLLASTQLLFHLLVVSLAMVRLQLSSGLLLVESLELYLAVNGLFLYWYWFFDAGLRRRSDGGTPIGVLFPEDDLEELLAQKNLWSPGWFDYLFLTVITSNSLGPPEGHSILSPALKAIQMLHSLSMISVFILILARAINTLG
jgi:hypothetical protein